MAYKSKECKVLLVLLNAIFVVKGQTNSILELHVILIIHRVKCAKECAHVL